MSKEDLEELMQVYSRLTPSEQYQLIHLKMPQNLIWVMPPRNEGRMGYVIACRMIIERLDEEQRDCFIKEQTKPLIDHAYDIINRFVGGEIRTKFALTQKHRAIAATYLIEADSFTRGDLTEIFQTHGIPTSNLKKIVEELVEGGAFKSAEPKPDGTPSYRRNVFMGGAVHQNLLRGCSKIMETGRSR